MGWWCNRSTFVLKLTNGIVLPGSRGTAIRTRCHSSITILIRLGSAHDLAGSRFLLGEDYFCIGVCIHQATFRFWPD